MIEEHTIRVLLWFFWIVFMSLEGYTEGIYWDSVLEKRNATVEHKLWTIQRVLFALSICAVYYFFTKATLLFLGYFGVVLIISSPFFHDGFYYYVRHRLNPLIYPRGFFDQSTTSTAFLTKYLTPIVRIILLTIAFIYIIFVTNN